MILLLHDLTNNQQRVQATPLSVSTLNDIFFLHERGTQAGVQAIWLSWGSSLAPVICGFLIQDKGWRWYHWLVSIMAGVDMILIFFFVPETQYPRDLHKSIDAAGVSETGESLSGQETPPSEMNETKSGAGDYGESGNCVSGNPEEVVPARNQTMVSRAQRRQSYSVFRATVGNLVLSKCCLVRVLVLNPCHRVSGSLEV